MEDLVNARLKSRVDPEYHSLIEPENTINSILNMGRHINVSIIIKIVNEDSHIAISWKDLMRTFNIISKTEHWKVRGLMNINNIPRVEYVDFKSRTPSTSLFEYKNDLFRKDLEISNDILVVWEDVSAFMQELKHNRYKIGKLETWYKSLDQISKLLPLLICQYNSDIKIKGLKSTITELEKFITDTIRNQASRINSRFGR